MNSRLLLLAALVGCISSCASTSQLGQNADDDYYTNGKTNTGSGGYVTSDDARLSQSNTVTSANYDAYAYGTPAASVGVGYMYSDPWLDPYGFYNPYYGMMYPPYYYGMGMYGMYGMGLGLGWGMYSPFWGGAPIAAAYYYPYYPGYGSYGYYGYGKTAAGAVPAGSYRPATTAINGGAPHFFNQSRLTSNAIAGTNGALIRNRALGISTLSTARTNNGFNTNNRNVRNSYNPYRNSTYRGGGYMPMHSTSSFGGGGFHGGSFGGHR